MQAAFGVLLPLWEYRLVRQHGGSGLKGAIVQPSNLGPESLQASSVTFCGRITAAVLLQSHTLYCRYVLDKHNRIDGQNVHIAEVPWAVGLPKLFNQNAYDRPSASGLNRLQRTLTEVPEPIANDFFG